MRLVGRSVLVTAVLATAAACASAPVRPATPVASTLDVSTAIAWVDRAAEYQALVRQTYGQATRAVETAARGRAAGTWAVILDADETVISNLAYQRDLVRTGQAHTPASWRAWVQQRDAVPLPGAQAFLDRVRALGGRIAIVTNRLETACGDTRAVLDRRALAYDVVLCQPDDGPSDKNPRFEAVAAGTWPGASGPLEVLAWVGDNIQDFPGLSQAIRQQGAAAYADFGARFFVLPNPLYGSWE